MKLDQFRAKCIEPLKKYSKTCPHPNFFIVGAAKSGTTSLWQYMKQHPQIAMPDDKEPSFFSLHYRSHKNVKAYLSLFAGVKEKVIGEASHAYFTSPESAELIQQVYPESKIIIILRNPVDRAFSLYQWMVREGYECISSFEKALSEEENRMQSEKFILHNPQYYYNYLYYNSGIYSKQIIRYFNSFPKSQIKILLFEEFKHDTLKITQEIYKFLDVDEKFVPIINTYNKAQMPLFNYGQFFFRIILFNILKKHNMLNFNQNNFIRYLMKMNVLLGSYRSYRLHPLTREKLFQRYKDDIRKTSKLVRRDLDCWQSPHEE